MGHFFQFSGSSTIRKRLYRHSSSDQPGEGDTGWQFTGAVFVGFDSVDSADAFVSQYKEPKKLLYKGDTLKVMKQREFWEEKGRFMRELAELDQKQQKEK